VLPIPALLYHLITSGPTVSLRSFYASTSRLATPQPEHIASQFMAVSFTHLAALGTPLSHTTNTSGNISITECLTTETIDRNRFLH